MCEPPISCYASFYHREPCKWMLSRPVAIINRRLSQCSSVQAGACRLITNLDYKVSDEDIQELFENCGSVLKAGIVYDRRCGPSPT